MKLHIFQSDNGDCILLETKDRRLVLCDGGMRASMRLHVRDRLAMLRAAGREIDFAYVSHIDQDHISGVLQLLEDELEWRVFDFHRSGGDLSVREPQVPRPPQIKGIWHNAFHDQVPLNDGKVEDLLAASAPALLATANAELRHLGLEMATIALSIPEAIKVSKLASPEVLNIPVNLIPGATGPRKLLMARAGQAAFAIGSSRWTILGPTEAELTDLRTGWQNFLRSDGGKEKVAKLRGEIKKQIERFSMGGRVDLDFFGVPDFQKVTVPNIASLMFVVEEDGKKLLLTGDSHHEIILKCLDLGGFLKTGSIHVRALKVQHHGSDHNLNADFARTVSADHYIFCGNGEHGNPEPVVLRHIFDSRMGAAAGRARAPEANGRKFSFVFSTNSGMLREGSAERKNFEEVERLVAEMVTGAAGKMKAVFNTGPVKVLTI